MTNTLRVMGFLMISMGVGGHIGFLKKAMNEILHTLQKISSYAYINSYQSLKKVCTPFPP